METTRIFQDRLIHDIENRGGEHCRNGVAIPCLTSTQVPVIVSFV
jgi:hypothetical protein